MEYDLQPKEKEVARLSSLGLETKEIADRMGIEPTTVNTHIQHIYEKTGAHNRVELSIFYNRNLKEL